MHTNKLVVNGLQIACNITHPEKENIIFFIHGNSTSFSTWRKQVESSLLADHRLLISTCPIIETYLL